jgi:soluble lytic murein transglycosylase
VEPAATARLAGLPAMIRAHELFLCDLQPLAAAEWQYGLDKLDAPSRVQAAALALSWQWYAQGIATAARQGVFDDFASFYPMPYAGDVNAAAARTGLPASLIYAIMRQESLYDPNVVSGAGAIGLLQLIPETARHTARHWHLPLPDAADLLRPQVSIDLGSAELRDDLDASGGQLQAAIAGYNAGTHAAQRWLPDTPRDADIWIENIPYNETRDYVQRVLWHMLVFGWRDSGQPQAPSGLTGTIAILAPRGAQSGPQP